MRTTKPVTGVEPGTGGFELQEAVCFIPVFHDDGGVDGDMSQESWCG